MTPPQWSQVAYQSLRAAGVTVAAYVPDIVLSTLIAQIEADPAVRSVCCTREEEAIGVLAGAALGGQRGVLLMQSSGLGNSINALTSLTEPYRFPLLTLISPRGDIGEWNPSQVPMGRILRPTLDLLGIQHLTADDAGTLADLVAGAARQVFEAQARFAIILSPLLTGGNRG
ncbi:MAG TPA: hypothetical protein VHL09_08080 [Dehalococcoidia bacterium]|nr:hypothetical protein [Dehalococcoidia bacterium]